MSDSELANNGSLINTNEPLVYLIGQDCDNEYVEIPYRLATLSSTLVKFIENSDNTNTNSKGQDIYEVKLEGFGKNILEHVKRYLEYKFENESLIKNSSSNKKSNDVLLDIPEFEYPQDISLELLMAADYLDI
ncbi:hypothetical protein HANVADRAFT_1240 [Hanseniaspora valbyensis NRRL Y-1626]|uniref:Elongin-C n=1 Tax=Hanseniaspora valbyensis NRRL Y-1626 TaxID=766949 RepID=A0A1B7THE8_9ASCO|nr:hypothetical protein HANVADRAFT_1240 [Hanseniaspora valbyensis NRRL Y-1626]